MTPAANFATGTTGVVDTGGKLWKQYQTGDILKGTWRKKFIYMLTQLTKGVPKKLLKPLWLKMFSFATGVNDTGDAPLAANISMKFWKNSMTWMVSSRAWGKLIHDKTCSRKSCGTVPWSCILKAKRKFFYIIFVTFLIDKREECFELRFEWSLIWFNFLKEQWWCQNILQINIILLGFYEFLNIKKFSNFRHKHKVAMNLKHEYIVVVIFIRYRHYCTSIFILRRVTVTLISLQRQKRIVSSTSLPFQRHTQIGSVTDLQCCRYRGITKCIPASS